MIRRNGDLPEGVQNFGTYLDQDLHKYGYSLMSTALRILETYTTAPSTADDAAGDLGEMNPTTVPAMVATSPSRTRSRRAATPFLQASYALVTATRNADPDTSETTFDRLIAGVASHMAGYAARAFSLVEASRTTGRLSPMELVLADLVMRDLDDIEDRTLRLRSSPELSDDALTAALSQADDHGDDAGEGEDGDAPTDADPASDPDQDPEILDDLGPITLLLSEHYLSSVSAAMFAIAFGGTALLGASIADLRLGEDACKDIAAPGPWWVFRLTRHLIADLDETSIRANLPIDPPGDDDIEALGALVDEGLIERGRGRGSTVAPRREHHRLVHRTSGLSAQLGSAGASVGTEVLSLTVQDADESTAVRGTPQILFLKRLRTADGVPIAVIHTWLPVPLFASLTAENLHDASLHAVLGETFGVQITFGKRQIRAVPGDRELLRLLNLDAGSPVLLLEGTSFDQDARPVEVFSTWPRGPCGVQHRHPARPCERSRDPASAPAPPSSFPADTPEGVADRARQLGADLMRLADEISDTGRP